MCIVAHNYISLWRLWEEWYKTISSDKYQLICSLYDAFIQQVD